MTVTANIHEAKTTLSKLIERALAGEEVVIAKAGKPLVKLTPVPKQQTSREAAFAAFQGKVILHEGWEEPVMDEQMLADFYGYDSVEDMRANEEKLRAVAESAARYDPE